MKMGEVSAVRDHSPASDKVKEGDKIVAAHGDRRRRPPSSRTCRKRALDPVRLPFELEQAADGAAVRPDQGRLAVRADDQPHVENATNRSSDAETGTTAGASTRSCRSTRRRRWRSRNWGSPTASRAPSSTCDPESPADKAGIQANDRIEEICFKQSEKNGPGKWGYWHKMKSIRAKSGGSDTDEVYDQWANYFAACKLNDSAGREGEACGATASELPRRDSDDGGGRPTWPLVDRGLHARCPTRSCKRPTTFSRPSAWASAGRGRSFAQIYKGLVSMADGPHLLHRTTSKGRSTSPSTPSRRPRTPSCLIAHPGHDQREPGGGEFPADPGARRRAHGLPDLRAGHGGSRRRTRCGPSPAMLAWRSSALLMLFVVYLDVSHWIWGAGR